MAKGWIYAWMSKQASEAGGPEAWIDAIKIAAYDNGVADTKKRLVTPLLLTGACIGSVGHFGYQKLQKWFVNRKEEKKNVEAKGLQAEKLLKKELENNMKCNDDGGITNV